MKVRFTRSGIFVLLLLLSLVQTAEIPNSESNDLVSIIIIPDEVLTPTPYPLGRGGFSVDNYNETTAISIFSDTDLASYATSGSGTEGDPYILENYNITDASSIPLRLVGTTKHTIIRNNIIDNQNGSQTAALFLSNADFVTVEDNHILNAENGIRAYQTEDLVINHNIIEKITGPSLIWSVSLQQTINTVVTGLDFYSYESSSAAGFYVSQTTNTLIKDTIIRNQEGYGLNLYQTTNVTLDNVTVINSGTIGAYLSSTNQTTIVNSNFTGGTYGIEVAGISSSYKWDANFSHNYFSGMTNYGIYDRGSRSTISNNTFVDINGTSDTAIQRNEGDYALIADNTFDNVYTGISLINSDYNIISHNTVTNSREGISGYLFTTRHNRILNNSITNSYNGIEWEPSTSSYNNTIKYNFLGYNHYGLKIGDNHGVNVTLNWITNSTWAGISLSGEANGVWILNNTIMNSSSHGLGGSHDWTPSDSKISFNDFYNNGVGNPAVHSQVVDYVGYNIEQNFYSDHSNVDNNGDGFADSSYTLDNGAYSDSQPLAYPTVPYTPIDITAPIIVTNPSSVVFMEYGSNGNNLTWNATDVNADTYNLTKDDVNISGINQSWTSGNAITRNIDGNAIGNYTYVITFTDQWGNQANHTVLLVVRDTIAPVFTEEPSSNDVEYGTPSKTWTASDAGLFYYDLWIDDSLIRNNELWASGLQNTIDISSFNLGSHNITLILTDLGNNTARLVTLFSVVDTGTPVIQTQPSSTAQFGQSEGTYEVTYRATDSVITDFYQIWMNETQIGSNTTWINNTDVAINLASFGLGEGTHNFTIIFYDTSGNYASHQISITVDDDVAPAFSSTPNSSVVAEYKQTGSTLFITATDANPQDYEIYLDDLLIVQQGWTSGVAKQYTIPDTIEIGSHNLTFYFNDLDGNFVTFEVTITVQDTIVPVLTETPLNVTYSEGNVGNLINWTATDANASSYIIKLNGVQDVTGTWTNGTRISYNIDGLLLGSHNASITFVDWTGNNITHTVFITITDDTLPSVSKPSDVVFDEGQTGYSITWTPNDVNPDDYTVQRNGTQVDGGTWDDGVDIEIDLNGLPFGIYTFIITIYDDSGNFDTDTVIVEVQDGTVPTMDSPADFSAELGSTGNTISWTGTDLHPDMYAFYLDETQQDNGDWISDTPLIFDVDGLGLGNHNLTLALYDLGGNMIKHEVTLQVIDTATPVISQPVDLSFTEGETGNSIVWTATDLSPDSYSISINGTIDQMGSWVSGNAISYNIDSFVAGTYVLVITVEDESGNSVSDIVEVVVLPEVVETTTTTETEPTETTAATETPVTSETEPTTTEEPTTTTTSSTSSEESEGGGAPGLGVFIIVFSFGLIIPIYRRRS